MFASMAAFLVAALCVPQAFGSKALLFACAYAVVRIAHIALYMIASREDPELRRSVIGLAVSSAVGAGLLVVASFTGGGVQVGIWGLALVLDAGGPLVFGSEGWRLVPAHFAERHGAIIIIALGESIVAIGAGTRPGFGAGVVAAAVLGMVVAAALWWAYFDVVAPVAGRRLATAEGRERNEMARDSYSYLHFPMIAGIALVAVGMQRTLTHVARPLGDVAATAMLGGAALYLLAHVAFRYRNLHTINKQRLLCAALLVALLLPLDYAVRPPSLVTLGLLAAMLSGLVGYEALRFAEARARVRHAAARQSVAD
jgi:low temperature requirement protein LtrA